MPGRGAAAAAAGGGRAGAAARPLGRGAAGGGRHAAAARPRGVWVASPLPLCPGACSSISRQVNVTGRKHWPTNTKYHWCMPPGNDHFLQTSLASLTLPPHPGGGGSLSPTPSFLSKGPDLQKICYRRISHPKSGGLPLLFYGPDMCSKQSAIHSRIIHHPQSISRGGMWLAGISHQRPESLHLGPFSIFRRFHPTDLCGTGKRRPWSLPSVLVFALVNAETCVE